MSSVKSQDTKPEIIVRKYLFGNGFRFRKNVSAMPGKPDIVLPKYKAVVFVHGCFWHGHKGCRHADLPKSNLEYWKSKIEKNIDRDAKNVDLLVNAGWKVIVLWECYIKDKKSLTLYLEKVVKQVKG